METSELVDLVYEAAIVPDLWPRACDAISGMIDGYSTALITFAPGESMRWTSSPHVTESMEIYERSGLAGRARRPQIALTIAPGAFMRDIDFLSPEEIASCPIYNELLKPLGLAWEMGAVFREPSGSMFVFSQLRRSEDGPFDPRAVDRMNALKPDLARAAFMTARLSQRHAQTVANALALVGLPGAVLGDRGNVLACNEMFDALSPQIEIKAFDRVHIASRQASQLFSEALKRTLGNRGAPVQSIPIPSADGTEEGVIPPLILHVVPVRRRARDVLARCAAILVVTPVGEGSPPDLGLLSGLFDLTPVETRVAAALSAGKSIDAVAIDLRVGRETVRSHLRAIFRKTGTNRQPQLVSLLSRIGQAAPSGD